MCRTEGEGCLEADDPDKQGGSATGTSTRGLTARTAGQECVWTIVKLPGADTDPQEPQLQAPGPRDVEGERRLRWTLRQGGDSGGGAGKVRAGMGESREAG